MQADVWDYQQWMSGERLDGCMGIFNMAFAPLTALVTMTVPTVYASLGFTSDWDILFSAVYRNRIFQASLAVGLVATVLSIIPFFFYDLTEDKHARVIEDLKRRKEAEDGML
jgi:GPH family glycoside/pentoside/hexuronide:cation symporter/probable glucitol transport protein GutA